MSSYVPIKLAYEVTEPEKRTNLTDLILIHGLSHSKIGWKSLVKKFANETGRRTYALDMRNHGDSEWSDDFSVDIMVKDVLHFMDEKKIKQALLIGQSMGAKIAMDLALAQPERVEKVVLEDLGPARLSESIRAMVIGFLPLVIKAIETLPPDASYEEAQKLVFKFLFDQMPEDMKKQLVKGKEMELPLTKKEGRYASKSNLNFLHQWVQNPDSFPTSKGKCTKPALFIYGSISPFQINKQEDLIMKLFPNAELQAVEGATHNVHGDLPDEFFEFVVKFVNES